MSVVSSHHFSLIRSRRGLEEAFAQGDWQSVRHWDTEIGKSLNSAFGDEEQDSRAIVDELEKILRTYGRMMATLPDAPPGESVQPKGQSDS